MDNLAVTTMKHLKSSVPIQFYQVPSTHQLTIQLFDLHDPLFHMVPIAARGVALR